MDGELVGARPNNPSYGLPLHNINWDGSLSSGMTPTLT
jgi:hypothetical protein